ncbi:MAG: alpha/beta fold hydrolase [Bacteroidota bacterium]|nr:alpha/beta fold hydrolase [Bacteroidota bacterium]
MKPAFFSFIILLLFAPLITHTQPITNYTGTWEGTLQAGAINLRIVFHIKPDGKGGLISTADSPDQSAYGFKCDSTIIKENGITILMSSLQASFSGNLINDSTIDGTFIQQADLPLLLKKTAFVKENKRPQTPIPPFPYKTEEVIYGNTDQSLRYGATISIPEGNAVYPAIVLITGSGPQDRDETIMGHKLFAVLADHLTRKGFIVLRVDDRGIGKSTGIFSEANSEDFSTDVSSSVDYLLSRPETDKKKIGLIGHSEGGMIAPMVAVKRKDIDFIVLMAGPGVPIIDLMAAQNEAIARSSAVSEAAVKEIKPLFKKVVTAIMEAPDSTAAITRVTGITENWAADKSKELLTELNFETTQKRSDYIAEMIQQFQSPWFRYFIRFNPGDYLEQLNCKVLALNGEKDIQVLSAQNLPGIESALKKSKSALYNIAEMPGLNHLFQRCKKCTLDEYAGLEETISLTVLETISEWLLKNVK